MGVNFVLMDKVTFPGEIHQTGHLVNSAKMGIGANATADLIEKLYARALELGVQTKLLEHIQKTENGYYVLYNAASGEERIICKSSNHYSRRLYV